MTDLLIIRPVLPNDFSQWQLLWKDYNHFYNRDNFPPGITKITWARFLDDAEPIYALVAEKSGELLGLAHYLFHRSTSRIESVCYMQDLFTVEKLHATKESAED